MKKAQEDERNSLKDPEITKMAKNVKSRYLDTYITDVTSKKSNGSLKRVRSSHSESSF